MAAPNKGIRKIAPTNVPQSPPDTAPTAVVLRSWLSLTAPSSSLTAMTGIAKLDQVLLLKQKERLFAFPPPSPRSDKQLTTRSDIWVPPGLARLVERSPTDRAASLETSG